MFDQITIFSTGMLVAALIVLCSVWLGSWLALRAAKGSGISIREPKGEVFTVEDVDDIPFPESETSEAESRVQGKVNKFLNSFNSSN